jgi:hypothetical protein
MPQTGAYVDLMFAFGHARLGDDSGARELLVRAAERLRSSVPDRSSVIEQGKKTWVEVVPRDDPAHQLLAKGFSYRIEHALAGLPHQGTLPAEVLSTLDEWEHSRQIEQKRDHYIVERMRSESRILELAPINPYRLWMKVAAGAEPNAVADLPKMEPWAGVFQAAEDSGNPEARSIENWLLPRADVLTFRLIRREPFEEGITQTHFDFQQALDHLSVKPVSAGAEKRPKDGWTYGELMRAARACMEAFGRCEVRSALTAVAQIFDRLQRLPNNFSTAPHYSRYHLNIAEAAVLALATDDFSATPAELRHRLGEVETEARRQALPQMRARVIEWGERDW